VPSVLSFIALLVFALILVIVPGLRSDWSPIVIMIGVMFGLLTAFGIFTWIRKVQEGIDRQHGRQRVPSAFKPSFRRWWYVRKSPMAAPALVIIALGLWGGSGQPGRNLDRICHRRWPMAEQNGRSVAGARDGCVWLGAPRRR